MPSPKTKAISNTPLAAFITSCNASAARVRPMPNSQPVTANTARAAGAPKKRMVT